MLSEKEILEECERVVDPHPQEKRGFLRGVRWAIKEIEGKLIGGKIEDLHEGVKEALKLLSTNK